MTSTDKSLIKIQKVGFKTKFKIWEVEALKLDGAQLIYVYKLIKIGIVSKNKNFAIAAF